MSQPVIALAHSSDDFTDEDEVYFRQQSEQMRQADAAISRDYAQLAEPKGVWLAFRDGKLVARAPTGPALQEHLHEAGLDSGRVAVRYLPPRGARLVPVQFPER